MALISISATGNAGAVVGGALDTTVTSSHSIVAFGDSIAAGEGSGAHDGFPDNRYAYSAQLAKQLGWDYYNFSISGGCASTATAGDPKTDAHCLAAKSIMTKQIPRVVQYEAAHGPLNPDIVTLTAGADDIFFSQCMQTLLLSAAGKSSSSAPDPCSPSNLKTSLAAYSANMANVLKRIHQLFPAARVVLTGYFDPLPATANPSSSTCFTAIKGIYLSHYFSQGTLGSNTFGLAKAIARGTFDQQVADYYNTNVSLRGLKILNQLNNTIKSVASVGGATYVPLTNFTGTSFCDDYTSTGYVLAPLATFSITVNWSAVHKFQEFDATPATRCRPSPSCYVKYFGKTGKKVIKGAGQTITIRYSAFAELNDFPHLTPSGQVAVASDINAKLGGGGGGGGSGHVYWVNDVTGTIGRANLDGTNVDPSFISGAQGTGVAVDAGHIYWASGPDGTIGRANLDGTGVNDSFITGIGYPEGVVVDAGHVYWTNDFAGTIGRANLDGTNVDLSFISGAISPSGVAVDAGHVYWTNRGYTTIDGIGRANLDGTNVDQSFISGATSPVGVAVDAGHIYWADVGSATIGRANLDGTNVDQSFISGAGVPARVAVDAGHIYWTDAVYDRYDRIGRANLDGTNVDPSFITSGTGMYGVAVGP